MALAGNFICSITGIDSLGGFNPTLDAILDGLGYAVPPIMALLFILDVCSLFLYSEFYLFSFCSICLTFWWIRKVSLFQLNFSTAGFSWFWFLLA